MAAIVGQFGSMGYALTSMIGVPGKDGGCAIKLLRKHDTHKLVGPGERGKAEHLRRTGTNAVVKSVGSADDKAQVTHAIVAQAGYVVGEFFTCEAASGFIERNQAGIGVKGTGDELCFVAFAQCGVCLAGFGKFRNLKSLQGNGGADATATGEIALNQLAFRP